jgi:hypothetical protein
VTLFGKCKRMARICGMLEYFSRNLERGAGVRNLFCVAGWGKANFFREHSRGTGIWEKATA